jgi:hypothetical protein
METFYNRLSYTQVAIGDRLVVTCRAVRLALQTTMRLVLSGVVGIALWAAGPAAAAPFTPDDDGAVRAVVQGQLDAFANDDGQRAFSFAAPSVRQAFGSAPAFMAMVKRSYPVVYRPASVAFLKPDGKDDEAIQRVQMTDAAGESWLAIYSLQRQKNRAWRITGCSVVLNRGRMA